ncbi:MAG: DUF748 domain-containing protein [Saprospiraceae bacterium]|nr:DUF748 domain-containing protein [Saprospiraceae bacterium]
MWILPGILENKIESIILREMPDSRFDKIDVDLYQNTLNLSKWHGALPIHIASLHTITGSISQVQIKNIHWWDLLKNHIHLDSLTINQPVFQIWMRDTSDVVDYSTTRTPKSQQKLLQIDQIYLHQGSINVLRKTDSLSLYSAESVDGQLNKVLINLGKDTPGRNDRYESFNFDISCIEILDDRRLHLLSIAGLNSRSEDSTLEISLFEMHPIWSTSDFNQKISKQTNEVNIVLPKVLIHGINYNRLKERTFTSREIVIPQFLLDNLVDKNIDKSVHESTSLPQQELANLNYRINVDSVSLSNGTLIYSELIPERTKAGEVSFHKINAKLKKITNDSTRFDQLKNIDLTVSAELFDDAPVHLNVQIPLAETPWDYYLRGTLGNFDLRKANGIVEPAVLMYFKSGQVSELSFEATANPVEARGSMEFFYRDLDIDFRQKKFSKKIRNALVEAFVFPQENIKTKKHNLAKIYCRRDNKKSVFNYLWTMVFSGIQSTMMPNILLPPELKHERVSPEHTDH